MTQGNLAPQMLVQPDGTVLPAQSVPAAAAQGILTVDPSQPVTGQSVVQPQAQYVDPSQAQVVYQTQPQPPPQYQV